MRKRAFTLLETLLTITMLVILGLVVGPILSNMIQSSTVVWARKQMLSEAQAGMNRMASEIRLIPSTSVIANIGSNNVQFQQPAGTSITYSLSGTSLLRNSDILIGNVSSLVFSYYDQQGNETTTIANVRSIGIQFTVNATGSVSSLTLRTRIFLRNTGGNYANFTSP